MKTILEWYQTLPLPIKKRAIKNLNEQNLGFGNISAGSIQEALKDGFERDESNEGSEYWNIINDDLNLLTYIKYRHLELKEVYVSDKSEKLAKEQKISRILIGEIDGNYLAILKEDINKIRENKNFNTVSWKYIVEVEKKERNINCTDEQWESIQEFLKNNITL